MQLPGFDGALRNCSIYFAGHGAIHQVGLPKISITTTLRLLEVYTRKIMQLRYFSTGTHTACFALFVLCANSMISYQHNTKNLRFVTRSVVVVCFHGWNWTPVSRHLCRRNEEASRGETKEHTAAMTKDGWTPAGGNDPSTWLVT